MWMLRSGLVGRARCCGADAADALGGLVELFGERERLFVLELGETLAVDAVPCVAAAADRRDGRGGVDRATMHGARAARRGPRLPVSAMSRFTPNGKERGGRRTDGAGGREVSKLDLATSDPRGTAQRLCRDSSSRGKRIARLELVSGVAIFKPGNKGGTAAINSDKSCVQYCRQRWRWEVRKCRRFSR